MVAGGGVPLNPTPDVLVVGAGPTGLTTALQAHAHGATVRVVERRPQAFRPSRALIVHPRTLESLRPLGVAEQLLDRGDRSPRAELHLGGRSVPVALTDVALPDTPYPHLTMVRQTDVEDVLSTALEERGVDVERGVELVDVTRREARLQARLKRDGAGEEVTPRFLVGSDGPASTVRRVSGIDWRGGPYREEIVLADLELDGDLSPGVLHVVAARSGLVFLFALGEGATWRLMATRRAQEDAVPFGQPGPPVPTYELRQILESSGLDAVLSELRWSARIRLQHRLAVSFRDGPVFLAGDAAHAHSPAAAQGMNTGILDAVNLGWKLGLAAGGSADVALLDSYEQERRPVARQVLALTHAVFFAEASENPLPAFLRGSVVPFVAPALPRLLRQRTLMALVVRMLSQGWVRYRHSRLSHEGSPGGPGPRPGDRLPDEEITSAGRRARLHDLVTAPGIHVLQARHGPPLDPAALGMQVAVHRVDSWPGRGLAVVRPDGHVGWRDGDSDPARLADWLRLVGAR